MGFYFNTIANFNMNPLKINRKHYAEDNGVVVDAGCKIEKWLVMLNSIYIMDSGQQTGAKHKLYS